MTRNCKGRCTWNGRRGESALSRNILWRAAFIHHCWRRWALNFGPEKTPISLIGQDTRAILSNFARGDLCYWRPPMLSQGCMLLHHICGGCRRYHCPLHDNNCIIGALMTVNTLCIQPRYISLLLISKHLSITKCAIGHCQCTTIDHKLE